jgi:tetratricopeptide (TPR) repeat protein
MEALLNKAVDLDPRFAAAWGALASVHSNAYFFSRDTTPARLQKADNAIATATRLAPETPEVLLSQGDYFYRAIRDYERALSHYNRVLLLRPNDPEVYNAIASVQRRQGKWVQAVATGRRSLALDPNQSRASFDLSSLLISGRRYDEGIDELRRLTPKPNIGLNAAYWVAESVWFASGSTDKMDKLFAAEGRDETIRRQLNERRAIWAMRTGDLATAVELIDFLMPPTGGSWWPADKVGRALVAKVAGRDQEAKKTLEPIKQALLLQRETEPKNPRVWCTLGLIEVLTGDKQEAIRCALQATRLQPESSDAYRGPAFSVCLALVYTWAGEKENAINEFARLLGTPIEQPLNVHEMRQSLWFRPLQGDPRFQALVNDPKNNAPLF